MSEAAVRKHIGGIFAKLPLHEGETGGSRRCWRTCGRGPIGILSGPSVHPEMS